VLIDTRRSLRVAPRLLCCTAPVPQLTGARCQDGALQVSIPRGMRRGFSDVLTFFGSYYYHIFDYNLYYANIRANAKARVSAHRASAAGITP
jgi:hypothetical protein